MPDVVITGDWKLVSFLREVSTAIDAQIKARAYAAAQLIRTEMLNLLSGQREGRTYRVPGTQRTYQASRPGEPPAVMLGDLRRSVKAENVESGFGEGEAIVGATMEYAPWLEFGTGRAGAAKQQEDVPEGYVHGPKPGMAPRPFLRPAIEHTREQVRRVLEGGML